MKKLLVGAFALAAIIAIPGGMTLAATYAYVNVSGEVMTMEAATPASAISTAPSIHPRSGVMLIETTADEEIVGDMVSGT